MTEYSEEPEMPASNSLPHDRSESLVLSLKVVDPELVAELLIHPEGEERNAFALTALRIGILTLKQVEGRLDTEAIRQESERLVKDLRLALSEHQQSIAKDLANSLQEYFDPKSGRFNERVDRLIAKDGELERFMQAQVGPDDSQMARTLAAHLGKSSPIMKLLAPEDAEGFLASLTGALDEALNAQRRAILAEFSLDNETSALSRLVKRLESSQGAITSEFSLDNERSALARLKRELLNVLKEHKDAADEFHVGVSEKLAAMTARREEALRSTRHGEDFEDEVRLFIASDCQSVGDVLEDTSNTTGLIKNSKVGDLVVTLGKDSTAAGARVVVEAKESSSYTIAKALDELETARKNRGAAIGLFIFSKQAAPPDLKPMKRYGHDVVVLWDPQDPSTDVYLEAGLAVARAICLQEATARHGEEIDLHPAEKAIRAIEKLADGLEEIKKTSETIQSGSTKILHRVRVMDTELKRQVSILDDMIERFGSLLP